MSTQPEALRLADELDADSNIIGYDKHAAELRRLHAENERLYQINQSHEMKLSVRGYENQIADLKAVNEELLGALEEYVNADPVDDALNPRKRKARAAIAKAGGKA
jgi:hypothetical protein